MPTEDVVRARRAISAMFLANGATIGGWIAHLPFIKSHLSLSSGELGACLLASGIGAVTTMPFAGYGIHRFGSRNTALMAGFLLLILTPLLVIAPSAASFALVLFLVGAVNGQMDVGMNAHSVAVQDRHQRPVLSAVHGWFSIGGFIGGGGAAWATSAAMAPAIHLIFASVVLGAVLIAASRNLLPAEVDANAEGPRFALPRGPLLLLAALALFAFITEGAVWDWTAVYFRTALGASGSVSALGFAVFSLGMAAGRFLGDSWINRFGQTGVLQLSGLATAAGLWMALLLPNAGLAMAGFALVGVGLANTIPILFRAAGSIPGVPAGTGLAAVTTCGYSGFLVGPPLVGAVAEASSLGIALSLISLLSLAVALAGKAALARSSTPVDNASWPEPL